jgi:hypothetical protein
MNIFWLILVIFFLFMALIMVIKLGGATLRQIIKSKLPGFKHKGAWFIQSDKSRKVKFIYKKIPHDLRVKIKSGDVPEEDQYAHINEIFHQTDGDGVPVLFTLEDLPFTFFLHKHHLDNLFPKIEEMISLINELAEKRLFAHADEIKLGIKNLLQDMSKELKYIPAAMHEIQTILALEKTENFKNKTATSLLLEYKPHLLRLKEALQESNHQMVNVYDLFQTIGFVKNLTNIAFLEFQNGFLAAKQTKLDKKVNTLLLVLIVLVGIISIIGIYISYNTQKQIEVMQLGINNVSGNVNQINQALGITATEDVNDITPITAPAPNNPLGG